MQLHEEKRNRREREDKGRKREDKGKRRGRKEETRRGSELGAIDVETSFTVSSFRLFSLSFLRFLSTSLSTSFTNQMKKLSSSLSGESCLAVDWEEQQRGNYRAACSWFSFSCLARSLPWIFPLFYLLIFLSFSLHLSISRLCLLYISLLSSISF